MQYVLRGGILRYGFVNIHTSVVGVVIFVYPVRVLTEISEVTSWKTIDGVRTPVPGELRYRGYDIFVYPVRVRGNHRKFRYKL